MSSLFRASFNRLLAFLGIPILFLKAVLSCLFQITLTMSSSDLQRIVFTSASLKLTSERQPAMFFKRDATWAPQGMGFGTREAL